MSRTQQSPLAALLLLLLTHTIFASPIVQLSKTITVKAVVVNATSPPPLGANRYTALALGAEGAPLESRELKEYFDGEELVARGLMRGDVEAFPTLSARAEPTATPSAPDERNPQEQAPSRSLFSFLPWKIDAIRNPKYIWNPKAHISKSSTSTSTEISTTTSAKPPTSTQKTCRLTVDCAGQPIPSNSHQYCDQPSCSYSEFRTRRFGAERSLTLPPPAGCNSGYTLFNSACVRVATTL